MSLIDGTYIPMKERNSIAKTAYYYLYTYRKHLEVTTVENPLTSISEKRIIFNDFLNQQKVIVLKNQEKSDCIRFFFDRSKGDGARKLRKRIANVFCKVTERDIQDYINNCLSNQAAKTKFDNKAPLKPVTSLTVWERVQIDLMSMIDAPIMHR